ncbi:MAG TPA: ABC transporter permease [Propionibacteriaceae bacterium]|nr:ABC transporter permease [Propionibacteriaceae bacterium]
MSGITIVPPGRFNLPPIRELWEAREVAWVFGRRDIVLRYRQTAIGVLWVVLQPLVGAGIFAIIFGGVAKLPSDGVPYFMFSYVGMLIWNVVANVLSRASASMVANQQLVAKVFFPRALVPLSSALSVLVDFAVATVLGLVLLLVFRVTPGWGILALPFWLACGLLLAMGLGLWGAALMVRFRDVAYVVPWLVQVGLYATPVAYAASAAPARLRWFFDINPLAWIIEGFRTSFLGLGTTVWWQVVAAPIASLVVFAAGLLYFQSRERQFADLI